MIDLPVLHIGGASAASVIISLAGLFLVLLIMSFAFWRGPQEERRFSWPWFAAWVKASAPRIIIAGVFCTGLFIASALSGSSGDALDPSLCDQSLPALTAEPVTPERLTSGILGLRRLADAARDGDVERARVIVYSDAHDITHDVDPEIRPVDPGLARDLCISILALEDEMKESDPDLGTIISEAERSAGLLMDASEALGFVE
jgi:hypothetical protein